VNLLYGIRIPRRDGKPVGGTEFSNMHAAYDALPDDLKTRLAGMTASHSYEKFWEHMRVNRGADRPPMTEEQRRARPPVSHPLFLTQSGSPAERCCIAIPATPPGSMSCRRTKASGC